MRRTKIALLVSFALVFAAGFVVGRLGIGWGPRHGRRPGLRSGLNLTQEQREQMDAIWSGVRELRERHGARRRELVEERDQAIRDLLSEDQLPRYEQLIEDYEGKLRLLGEQRQAAIDAAQAQTNEILTPEQRKKYAEFLDRMRERGPRRRHGAGRPPGRPGPGPFPAPRQGTAQ